jgi:hypothetical protein
MDTKSASESSSSTSDKPKETGPPAEDKTTANSLVPELVSTNHIDKAEELVFGAGWLLFLTSKGAFSLALLTCITSTVFCS